MDRRTFLKTAGFGSVALFLGGVTYRVGALWWDQAPAQGFKHLSHHEATVVRALADAMFPGDSGFPPMPNGGELGLDAFFDQYLASVPELTVKLLKVLLHAIDDMTVVADFGLTRFHRRPQAERIEILQAWDTSWIGARRGMFRSLKLILGMGYCEHPEVLAAAGITYNCGGES